MTTSSDPSPTLGFHACEDWRPRIGIEDGVAEAVQEHPWGYFFQRCASVFMPSILHQSDSVDEAFATSRLRLTQRKLLASILRPSLYQPCSANQDSAPMPSKASKRKRNCFRTEAFSLPSNMRFSSMLEPPNWGGPAASHLYCAARALALRAQRCLWFRQGLQAGSGGGIVVEARRQPIFEWKTPPTSVEVEAIRRS